jgi:hypothetical protein
MNNRKDHLYLSGQQGLTKVRFNRDNLSTVYSLKKGNLLLKKTTLEA